MRRRERDLYYNRVIKKDDEGKDRDDSRIWDNFPLISRLDKNEKIIFIVREHVLLITLKAVGFILLSFLLLVGYSFMKANVDSSVLFYLYTTAMFFANLFFVTLFAMQFHNYYLSIQVVTNMRIIDIDQTRLLKREFNEISMIDIQNVNYKQNGLLATVFDFGDVIVETAGEQHSAKAINGFVFDNVPRPKVLVEKISRLYHESRDRDNV